MSEKNSDENIQQECTEEKTTPQKKSTDQTEKITQEKDVSDSLKKKNKEEKVNDKSADKKTKKGDKSEKKEKPPKPKTVEEKLADALAEIDKLKNRNLYLLAEMENSRKIGKKRIEMARHSINADVIKKFLPVVESLEAAISRLEKTVTDQDDNGTKFLKGFKQVQTQFMSILKISGVKPIDKVNIPFNYKEHEVMMKFEDDSKPEDTVIQIVQKGWYLRDSILRPAKVVVSKKKPKPVEKPKESEKTVEVNSVKIDEETKVEPEKKETPENSKPSDSSEPSQTQK